MVNILMLSLSDVDQNKQKCINKKPKLRSWVLNCSSVLWKMWVLGSSLSTPNDVSMQTASAASDWLGNCWQLVTVLLFTTDESSSQNCSRMCSATTVTSLARTECHFQLIQQIRLYRLFIISLSHKLVLSIKSIFPQLCCRAVIKNFPITSNKWCY